MTTYITSIADFRRIVDGWLQAYDMHCYAVTYDDFVDYVAMDLLCLAKNRGFTWGSRMPVFSDDDFDDVTSQYCKDKK